jgi:hypothetical protein
MKLLLIAATLLIGSSSFANFTGRWQGDGIVTTKDGKQVYCDEIIINVAQTDDKLTFGKFRYGCDELAFNFNPPELKVEDGNVIWKDQDAGKITDKNANLHFVLANNGKSRYTAELESPNEMNYLDEQIDYNPNTGEEKITSIKAKLFQKK